MTAESKIESTIVWHRADEERPTAHTTPTDGLFFSHCLLLATDTKIFIGRFKLRLLASEMGYYETLAGFPLDDVRFWAELPELPKAVRA